MIKVNKKMEPFIYNQSNLSKEREQIDNIVTEIVNNTQHIGDCFIYEKDKLIEIDFNKIWKLYKDRTSYEVSCNEFIYEKNITVNLYIEFGRVLRNKLERKFNQKFVVYIMLNEKTDPFFEIRFHANRIKEGEIFWLEDNLDNYDVPIAILY